MIPNNFDILIPYKYTKYAHISSLPVFLLSYSAYYYSERLLSFLAFITYITTNLHWYKLKSSGFIREIDRFFVILTALRSYIAAYYGCYFYFYRYLYFTMVTFSIFLFNEYLNYKTLYKYHVFNSLTPYEKHCIYIRSCFIHMITLHVIQCSVGSFYLIYLYTPY